MATSTIVPSFSFMTAPQLLASAQEMPATAFPTRTEPSWSHGAPLGVLLTVTNAKAQHCA
jgi:hypothetical protein